MTTRHDIDSMATAKSLPFTPEASFLDSTDHVNKSTASAGSQPAKASSTSSAVTALPAVFESSEGVAELEFNDQAGLLRYFIYELDVEKVNAMENHLWLAGQRRSCRPLHMQKVLGREIVVVETCHLHLTWRDSTIFIKPCPNFLLDHSIWETYLSKDDKLYRNAFGFLRTYVSLVRRKSDLKIAHELGLLSPNLKWTQWVQISRLVARLAYATSLTVVRNGKERTMYDRWCYGELRIGRLNWIYRFCLCGKRERGQLQRGFFNQYQDYRSFLDRNMTWLSVSTIYVALVLAAMQVGLGTDRLKGNGRFTDAAVGFTIFSIIAPLSIIAIIAGILLYKSIDNGLYTLQRMKSHKSSSKDKV